MGQHKPGKHELMMHVNISPDFHAPAQFNDRLIIRVIVGEPIANPARILGTRQSPNRPHSDSREQERADQ